jgi:hypothetical protein
LLDPDDILSKVTYALTNPVKDHLVEHAEQWPGASSLQANLEGHEITAVRPRHFFKQGRGQPESLTLKCERPSAFKAISEDEWRELLTERIRAVEEAAAAERRTRGFRVLGRREVLRQNPTDRPSSDEPRRVLNPTVAGMNKWRRAEAIQRNKTFLAAYRAARDLWQSGFDTVFPAGTYWLRLFAGVPVWADAS